MGQRQGLLAPPGPGPRAAAATAAGAGGPPALAAPAGAWAPRTACSCRAAWAACAPGPADAGRVRSSSASAAPAGTASGEAAGPPLPSAGAASAAALLAAGAGRALAGARRRGAGTRRRVPSVAARAVEPGAEGGDAAVIERAGGPPAILEDESLELAFQQRAQESLLKVGREHKMPILKWNDPSWEYFDVAMIYVRGGNGGRGCKSFRREKNVPFGGPDGGNGGHGGHVYLECAPCEATLNPLKLVIHCHADHGVHGEGKKLDGKNGEHKYLKVPPGSCVYVRESWIKGYSKGKSAGMNELVCFEDVGTRHFVGELTTIGQKLRVARGGVGATAGAAAAAAAGTHLKRPRPGSSAAERQPLPPGLPPRSTSSGSRGSLGDIDELPLTETGIAPPRPPPKRPLDRTPSAASLASAVPEAAAKAKGAKRSRTSSTGSLGAAEPGGPAQGNAPSAASGAPASAPRSAARRQSEAAEPAKRSSSSLSEAEAKRSLSSSSLPAAAADAGAAAGRAGAAEARSLGRSLSNVSDASSADVGAAAARQAAAGSPGAEGGQGARAAVGVAAAAAAGGRAGGADGSEAAAGRPEAGSAAAGSGAERGGKAAEGAGAEAAAGRKASAAEAGEEDEEAEGDSEDSLDSEAMPFCPKVLRGFRVAAKVPVPPPWAGLSVEAGEEEGQAGEEEQAEAPLNVPALFSLRELLEEQHPQATKDQARKAADARGELRGRRPPTPQGAGAGRPAAEGPGSEAPEAKPGPPLPQPPPGLAAIGRRDPLSEAIRSMENRLARQGLLAAPTSILGDVGAKKAPGCDAELFYDPTDNFIDDADLEEVNAYDKQSRRPLTAEPRRGRPPRQEKVMGARMEEEESGEEDDAGSQQQAGKKAAAALNLAAFRLSGAEISGTSGEESGSDMDSDLEGAHRVGIMAPKLETRDWREQIAMLERDLVLVPALAIKVHANHLEPGVTSPRAPPPLPALPAPPAAAAASAAAPAAEGAAASAASAAAACSQPEAPPQQAGEETGADRVAVKEEVETQEICATQDSAQGVPEEGCAAEVLDADAEGRRVDLVPASQQSLLEDGGSVDVIDADAEGADITHLRAMLRDFGAATEQATRGRTRSQMQANVEAAIRSAYRRLPQLVRPTTNGPRPLRWKLHTLEPYTSEARYPGEVLPWADVEEVAWGRYLWRIAKSAAPSIGRSSFMRRYINATREPQREIMAEAVADAKKRLLGVYTSSCRVSAEAAVKRWSDHRSADERKGDLHDLRPLVSVIKNLQKCWFRQRFWDEQRKLSRLRAPMRKLSAAQLPCFSIYVCKHVQDCVELSVPMDMAIELIKQEVIVHRPLQTRQARNMARRSVIPSDYVLPLQLPIAIWIKFGEHKVVGTLHAMYSLDKQSVQVGQTYYKSLMQAAQVAVAELKSSKMRPGDSIPLRTKTCLQQKHGAWTLWKFQAKHKVSSLNWALKLAQFRKISAFVNPANEPPCQPITQLPSNPNKDLAVSMRSRKDWIKNLKVGQWVECCYATGNHAVLGKHYNAQIVHVRIPEDASARTKPLVDVEYVHGERELQVNVSRLRPVLVWKPEDRAAVRISGQWWKGVVMKVTPHQELSAMQFEVKLHDRTVTVPFGDIRQEYSGLPRGTQPYGRSRVGERPYKFGRFGSSAASASMHGSQGRQNFSLRPSDAGPGRLQAVGVAPPSRGVGGPQGLMLRGTHVKYKEKGFWTRAQVVEDRGSKVLVATVQMGAKNKGADGRVLLDRGQLVRLPGRVGYSSGAGRELPPGAAAPARAPGPGRGGARAEAGAEDEDGDAIIAVDSDD